MLFNLYFKHFIQVEWARWSALPQLCDWDFQLSLLGGLKSFRSGVRPLPKTQVYRVTGCLCWVKPGSHRGDVKRHLGKSFMEQPPWHVISTVVPACGQLWQSHGSESSKTTGIKYISINSPHKTTGIKTGYWINSDNSIGHFLLDEVFGLIKSRPWCRWWRSWWCLSRPSSAGGRVNGLVVSNWFRVKWDGCWKIGPFR